MRQGDVLSYFHIYITECKLQCLMDLTHLLNTGLGVAAKPMDASVCDGGQWLR